MPYLTDRKKREKINKILKREEGIAMAGEELIRISRDDRERARLLSEWKYILDTQSMKVSAERKGLKKGLREGRKIGRAEGRTEGKVEANIENARKMKTMGFPVDQIQAIAGLSKETIEKL